MQLSHETDYSRFFISCPRHSEQLLRDEVLRITGADSVSDGHGGVFLDGTLEDAYRICLWSHIAGRVFLELSVGEVAGRSELYSFASQVAWEQHFTCGESFAVSAHSAHREFQHSNMPVLVVKDAIADRFRNQTGERPSVDTSEPDIRIFLYLTDREARLSIDLSGESLHRREYRVDGVEAPLRENTAAAVLYRSGWREAVDRVHRPAAPGEAGPGSPPVLIDPMCGSGTIAIEAALMACDRAPGLDRRQFGFERWRGHDAAVWRQLRDEAIDRSRVGHERWLRAEGRIWASDHDGGAVRAARKNAARVGAKRGAEHSVESGSRIADLISFEQCDATVLSRGAALGPLKGRVEPVTDKPLFIVTNPPYGARLDSAGSGSGRDIYGEIGLWMSRSFRGFRATILAETKEQCHGLGLRAEKINSLYNGGLKIVVATLRLDATNAFRDQRPPAETTEPANRRSSAGGSSDDRTHGTAMLVSRFRKNRKRLKKYLLENEVTCYRLYDADIPQHAAAVDVYTDIDGRTYAVVQEYAAPSTIDPDAAARRLDEIVEAVGEYLEISQQRIVTKQRRRQRGSSQYTAGSDRSTEVTLVMEDSLFFEVNLSDYIDTGLFMDQRITRKELGEMSHGKRVLNLFAYTCSASVYAAAGGASQTVSVDRSNTYLDWGMRNFDHNGISADKHLFERVDSLEYLRGTSRMFDLMYIDPPSFSNTRATPDVFDVQRDHEELLGRALARLEAEGTIVFATNLRRFEMSDVIGEVGDVADISDRTVPPDFVRSRGRRHVFTISHRGS